MYNVLIMFASVTTANRVKSVLEKKLGIRSYVVRAPALHGLEGCSYAVKLSSEHLDSAWNMVIRSGVSSKGAYREDNLLQLKQRWQS